MKKKLIDAYLKVAETFSELSHAKRLHVGAIVVKDDRIISIGYNGMPAGWDNNCEDRVYNTRFNEQSDGSWIDPLTYETVDIAEIYPFVDDEGKRYYLKTKPEVLHAESNALAKLARGNESGLDADLFVTHAPCLDCAKLIHQSGIKRVFFGKEYRSTDGLEFLKKSNVEIIHVKKGD